MFLLPAHTKRGITQHEIEPKSLELIPAETRLASNVSCILAHYQHVRFRDCIGLRIRFLPVHHNLHIGIDVTLNVLLCNGKHAACSAGRVKDCSDNAPALKLILMLCKKQIHHEADDFTRGVMLSSGLIRHLGKPSEKLLEDISHLMVIHNFWMEVNLRELTHKLEQEIAFV
ncbi:hypothetical protein BMS3Abin16_01652 [archaeon BMS3Abin16]|nr:hypothetical protein BMS3Abin16_01652 [archaeon BMS3Abin16]